MYSIYVSQRINDEEYERHIKTYPFKIQCIIWLYLHGWVMDGVDDWTNDYVCFPICPSCPSAKVKIVKEQESYD